MSIAPSFPLKQFTFVMTKDKCAVSFTIISKLPATVAIHPPTSTVEMSVNSVFILGDTVKLYGLSEVVTVTGAPPTSYTKV